MTHSIILVNKFHQALANVGVVEERKMFGSLGFMVNDKLTICVGKDNVMYKVGVEAAQNAVESYEAEPVVMGKRVMKGWVIVKNDQLESNQTFDKWLRVALDYTHQTLSE